MQDLTVEAWQRAVASLPIENLTPAQEKQRAQYQKELAAAEAKLADLTANPKQPPMMSAFSADMVEKMPWNRAVRILVDYSVRKVWQSSVSYLTASFLTR